MFENMPVYLAHFNDMIPGKKVLDRLRCRKTILEILSPPIEVFPFSEDSELGRFTSDLVSSWMVMVKNLREERIFSTLIQCDSLGNISRFELYQMLY